MQAAQTVVFLHGLGESTEAWDAQRAAVSSATLVLCGEKDRPNMPAARALAAGIRGAELRIIPGAGHQSHMQAPEAFATLLGEFLTRVRAQDADNG